MRWLGRKPHNRGTAMNPIDHPMGGGEGRTGGGGRPQVGPTGVLSKGGKTRSRKKAEQALHRSASQRPVSAEGRESLELNHEPFDQKRAVCRREAVRRAS